MLHKLRKSQSGFSIVEVMIVLAIAGLIILVVFLAVPALNRNSRNTSIKQAVSSVGALIGEFRGSNSGKNPTTIAISNGTGTVSGGTGTTAVNGNVDTSLVSAAAGTAAPTTADGSLVYRIGFKCNGTATVASSRSIALLYVTETANGVAPQCLDA